MKAVLQDQYGDLEVLGLREVDKPVVGESDILIRVHAAGVDPSVWHLMTGKPYVIRLAGFGVRAPKQRIRGTDVAGVVEEVGSGVAGRRAGDRVFGVCDGSFAEYVVVRAGDVERMPADLSFEQAAALPVSATTAAQALRRAGVEAGQTVLVVGAGGGVGVYAVQFAKAFGAEVTGVCSGAKADLVRSLGADHVVDYTREDFAGGRKYDVVVDIAGSRSLRRLRKAVKPRGTLVIVGGEGGGGLMGAASRSAHAALLSPFTRQRLAGLIAKVRQADLQSLVKGVESGEVAPVLDRSFPLADFAEAIRYVREGRARGKVVLRVAAD